MTLDDLDVRIYDGDPTDIQSINRWWIGLGRDPREKRRRVIGLAPDNFVKLLEDTPAVFRFVDHGLSTHGIRNLRPSRLSIAVTFVELPA